MKCILKLAVSAVVALLTAGNVASAQQFPTKPVKIIVPLAAGGGLDTLARQIADRMTQSLGQSVVVENRAGGGGAVAATFLKAQPGDGYTIGIFTSTALTFTPLQGNVAYKLDDFAPIVAVMRRSTGLIANSNAPFKGWDGLVTYGKSKGALSFASQSQVDKLIIERIGKQIGIKMNVVPTQGAAEIRTMVMGGHVDFGISGSVGFRETAAGGPLQLLAVLDPTRNPSYRDAPTLKELGFDTTLLDHYVVVAPASTPPAIGGRIADALIDASKDASVQKLVTDVIGGAPLAIKLDLAGDLLRKEAAGYKTLVSAAK